MSLVSSQLDPGHNTKKKFEMDPVNINHMLPSMPLISTTPFKSDSSDNSMEVKRVPSILASNTPTVVPASTNLSVTVASEFSRCTDSINITICGSTLNGLKLYPTPIIIRKVDGASSGAKDETGEEKTPSSPEVTAPVLRTGRSGSKLALALKQNSLQPGCSHNPDQNDTGQDNEDEMAALMAASSTIKGNKKKQFPQVPNPIAIRKKKQKELKDSQLLLSMIDPEKEYFREENRKNLANAFFYLMKDRMEENKDTELLNKIIQTMTEFDAAVTPVTEFYNKMMGLLGNYPELAKQFIIFLLPEQAWECGKFMEYIKIENMRKFVKKMKAFFAKQPQLFRLVFAALENLSDNDSVTVDEVKSTIIPLLKGNSLLIDSFLSLIPQGRPPESMMSVDIEDMDFDSDNSGNEEEKLVLPNQPDVYGNDHCICFCHDSTDDKFRTRFFHCVSCGTRFIQGRVYLQTARHSRLANVVFPEDECQAKRIYMKKIPPKVRERREKKPRVRRKKAAANLVEDSKTVSPDAAQSSAAEDPTTPKTSNYGALSANADTKRSKNPCGRPKNAARLLDMSDNSSSAQNSSSNCLTNDSGIGVMHLSQTLLNQTQDIYSLDQEFVTVDAFNHNRTITEGTNVLSVGCRLVSQTLENVGTGLSTFDYHGSGSINNSFTTYSVNNGTLDLFDLQGAVPLENVACVAMEAYDGELCPAENSGDYINLEVYNNNVEMGTLLNAQNTVESELCGDLGLVESVNEETMETSYALPVPVNNVMEVDSHQHLPESDFSALKTTFNVSPRKNAAVPENFNEDCINTYFISGPLNQPIETITEPIAVLNNPACGYYQATCEPVVTPSTFNCEHPLERTYPESHEDSAEVTQSAESIPENSGEKNMLKVCEDEVKLILPENSESVTAKTMPENSEDTVEKITSEHCENADEEMLPEKSTHEILPASCEKAAERTVGENCADPSVLTTCANVENADEATTSKNSDKCGAIILEEAVRRETLPWTKDEDKVILLEVQRGYCLEKTFQNMTGLPERSLTEIRDRFQLLMKMLQEMTHPKRDGSTSPSTSVKS